MDDRNSLVRREFAAFMPEGGEEIIREKFTGQKEFIDSDINISADQTRKLAAAIRTAPIIRNPRTDGSLIPCSRIP
jgi:hypothetical protein